MSTLPSGDASSKVKVVWARDLRGREPARAFLQRLEPVDRIGIERTIRRLEAGEVIERSHFASLGSANASAHGLFELRQRFARLLGAFQDGRFVLAHGLLKRQKWEIPRGDLDAAQRILREHRALQGTRSFVRERVPVSRPGFRPTIVPPTKARPDPAPVEIDLRATAFRPIASEYVWTFAKQSDLLSPDAPLMQSLVRLPRIHNLLMRDELEPYIGERLAALSPDARLALGLIDAAEARPTLMLGAIWAIELMTARALLDIERTEPPPAPETEQAPEPTSTPELPEITTTRRLYWLTIDTRNRWGACRTRYLYEVLGPLRRTYRKRPPKVYARMWSARSKQWRGPQRMAESLFKDKVSLRDPVVIEALKHD